MELTYWNVIYEGQWLFSSYLSKTQMSMQENKWETKALQCIIVTEATLRIYHDGEGQKSSGNYKDIIRVSSKYASEGLLHW